MRNLANDSILPGSHDPFHISGVRLLSWTYKYSRHHQLFVPLYTVSELTTHNWQEWKRVFLTCPCHKIYRGEAVGRKSCKYTWKITIYVNMWNFGQFREKLIFCQELLYWSSNLKILLHMSDTYNCDNLKHSTFRFNLIDFQLNTDFPSQFCVFYRKIT